MNRLEELYKELKQKDKELDEYIETHRNHLSDEAEAIRKDIYRITDKINLLEKARNVGNQDGYRRGFKDITRIYRARQKTKKLQSRERL